MSNLKTKKLNVNDPTVLYHKYPTQQYPQDAYLEMDCDKGTLRATTDGEIGGAVPMRVFHGRVRRYSIPEGAQPADVNKLMDDLVPIFERVLAGYECEWDGSNHTGRLDDAASQAEEEIEQRVCDAELRTLYVEDAGDWFSPTKYEHVDAVRDGRMTIEDVRDEVEAEDSAPDGNPMLLERIDDYLDDVIEDVRDED